MMSWAENKPPEADYSMGQRLELEKTTAYLLYVAPHLFTVASALFWT